MVPKSLSSVLKKQKIKGVFLMPNCANPTTITMPLERKKEIAEIARRNNVIIIEDDASLSAEASTSFFSLFPENTFYLTGNTRFISPGLRVAFVAYPNRFKEKFLNALHKLTIKGSALDAEIMSELILNGSAEKILLQKINRAKTMNKTFDAIFPNLARESEDMPFFRTIPLTCSNATGQEIEQTLLKKNIRICHSYRFAATRNPKTSFLRVSLSSVDSKTKLANALKTIKDFLNDYL
jgi:DNA-binding transcriptional MocR family regulator